MPVKMYELDRKTEIVLYKLVEINGNVRRKDLIDKAKETASQLLHRDVSKGVVEFLLRRMTDSEDKKSKKDIFGRSKRGAKVSHYYIKEEGKPSEKLKDFWKKTEDYIRRKKGWRSITDELRIKHTENIQRRVVKPWLTALSKQPGSLEFMEDLLYQDLKNHLPEGIDPFALQKELKELHERIDKEKEEIKNAIKPYANEIKEEWKGFKKKGFLVLCLRKMEEKGTTWAENLELKRGKDRKEDTVTSGVNTIFKGKLNVYNGFVDCIKEACSGVEEDKSDSIKDMKKLIGQRENKKKELVRQLKKLEAYEMFPGTCKYLIGCR